MPPDKPTPSHSNTNISIGGDVVDSAVIVGDNNTVNQTVIQKFINIFKSDAETLEQRNRRILLNHVETAWIKGVLDASLYGAAMLDLGIKENPEAVTDKYPWTIKKESTNEALPAGTSMLEIFDSIGMGRSLLILGAPGSGKTTMLLELARGLIARAREDVTQPIPMVFNLSSWTESKNIADWLAQELNNLYSVPRKTAPDWVKGNKLLLLLDGLDEVRQESRAKCVEAINEFRKQNGLTSLAVCSRSQDYAELNAKLSFEGAIEVQPLTQEQITEFFNRFGDEMAGIKQALEKDGGLREIAETPLFLSVMLMAYRDKKDVDILVSGDEKAKRKHLFDTYIERMFEHSFVRNVDFKKQNILRWLSWLAQKMIQNDITTYYKEMMQIYWLESEHQRGLFRLLTRLIVGFCGSLVGYAFWGVISIPAGPGFAILAGIGMGIVMGTVGGLSPGLLKEIDMNYRVKWSLTAGRRISILIGVSILIGGLIFGLIDNSINFLMLTGLFFGLILIIYGGLVGEPIEETIYPNQRLKQTFTNALVVDLAFGPVFGLVGGLINGIEGCVIGLILGLVFGMAVALDDGISQLIKYFVLRFIMTRNGFQPLRLIPFLNHCVDLIFLRRVGGGYIFIHRLLMEHFAEMCVESPTSKGN